MICFVLCLCYMMWKIFLYIMLFIFGLWILLKILDDVLVKIVFILMLMILNKIDWNIEFYFICYRMGMINFERICKWLMEVVLIMCLNVFLRLFIIYNKLCLFFI